MFRFVRLPHGGQGFRWVLPGRQLMQFPRDKQEKLSIRTRMLRPHLLILAIFIGLYYPTNAATPAPASPLTSLNRIVISVRDQKLMLLQNDAKVAVYPVSTSKY